MCQCLKTSYNALFYMIMLASHYLVSEAYSTFITQLPYHHVIKMEEHLKELEQLAGRIEDLRRNILPGPFLVQ